MDTLMSMNIRVLISFIFVTITMIVSLLGIIDLKSKNADVDNEKSQESMGIDKAINCKKSDSVYTGKIYTIDGEAMIVQKESDNYKPYTEPTSPAYEMLKDEIDASEICENILFSGSLRENKALLRGDDIQTTIHSNGQKKAFEELASYVGTATNANIRGAQMAVLLPDGAVLVYARFGEVTQTPQSGSSAKALFSRIYSSEEFRDGTQFDIGNIFKDHNYTVDNGVAKHNHNGRCDEDDVPSVYPTYDDDFTDAAGVTHHRYHREIDFKTALIDSSNVYFIEHADHFGRTKVLDALNKAFFFDSSLKSDVLGTIPAVTNNNTKNDVDFFFGQGMYISPVRLCASMNASITGDFFMPFYVAQVISPDRSIIYQSNPEVNKHNTGITVDRQNDLVIPALKACYSSYNYYDDSVLKKYDGRIIAKSGTAEVGNDQYTRTMLISVFDETEEQNLLCSAVLVAERSNSDSVPTNDQALRSLVSILEEIGILE